MSRALFLVSSFLLISVKLWGQCPTLTISSTSGTTCGVTPITVSGNTFGGSASQVTISHDGSGNVSPALAVVSPFSFTYTPALGDVGKTVTISLATDDLSGICIVATATYTLTVADVPSTPVHGTVTQPTCTVTTGSVVLNSLPAAGTWTLTRSPDGVVTTGTGTSTTVTGLTPGTYSWSVAASSGCTSSETSGVVINSPPVQSPPTIGTVTQPTCSVATGSIRLNGLPGGGWTITQSPGDVIYTGNGGNFTVTSLTSATYTFTVTNSSGCTSNSSTGVTINPQPVTPTAPGTGTITQPACGVTTGSVELTGLPSSGTWTVTRSPGGITTTGTGTSSVISGIPSGTFTFTVTSSSGCTSPSSGSVVINPMIPSPSAPVIGTVTQPTCIIATGSAVINNLPASGTWTLTRSPGGTTTTGSGTSTTVSNLNPGTYTFTVTNSFGCVSPSSGNLVISPQPAIPTAPHIGTITVPTCTVATGSVVLSGLPSAGVWTLTRSPGNITTTGTGTSSTVTGVPAGTYTYTVTNNSGCVSPPSASVVIPSAPGTPTTPLIGLITQPTFETPTGSVVVAGLPVTGTWTLTLAPANTVTQGTGTTITIHGLASGIYSFTVTNAAGCTSAPSSTFQINVVSGPPVVVITNPKPVCFPSTVNITIPGITVGSTPNLIYTYWTDAAATVPFTTPGAAPAGTYYIKGTTSDGFFTIKPVIVSVYHIPVPNAGPDQNLPFIFSTQMSAVLANTYETGVWSRASGTGLLADSTNARTTVNGLSQGVNKFYWTVTNGVCPVAVDSVILNVRNKAFPTLITPNMDGKNDYFVIPASTNSGKLELIIFDRRGVEVYRNEKYENSWNGVDNNGKELPDDTYFYVLKPQKGSSSTGFIVVRRLN